MTLDVNEAKGSRNEFALWLEWTLATAGGMLLGLLPFVFLTGNLDLWLARILVPVTAGFIVGFLQWSVLRQYLTHCADWILYGGAGWSLGYALALVIIQRLNETPLGALIGYAVFGIIIGVMQWPVLRREIRDAVPWVLANVVAWATGFYISQAVLNIVASDDIISQALSTAVISGVTGLVAGGITGLALVWTVRRPERELVR